MNQFRRACGAVSVLTAPNNPGLPANFDVFCRHRAASSAPSGSRGTAAFSSARRAACDAGARCTCVDDLHDYSCNSLPLQHQRRRSNSAAQSKSLVCILLGLFLACAARVRPVSQGAPVLGVRANTWRLYRVPRFPTQGKVLDTAARGTLRMVLGGIRVEYRQDIPLFAEQVVNEPIERSCRINGGWVHVTASREILESREFLGPLTTLGSMAKGSDVAQCGPLVATRAPEGDWTVWSSDGPRVIDSPIVRLRFASETVGKAIAPPDQLLETTDGGRSFTIRPGSIANPEAWLGPDESPHSADADAKLLQHARAAWESRIPGYPSASRLDELLYPVADPSIQASFDEYTSAKLGDWVITWSSMSSKARLRRLSRPRESALELDDTGDAANPFRYVVAQALLRNLGAAEGHSPPLRLTGSFPFRALLVDGQLIMLRVRKAAPPTEATFELVRRSLGIGGVSQPQVLQVPLGIDRIAFADRDHGLASDGHKQIYMTSDGGVHWSAIERSPSNDPNAGEIACVPQGCVVGTELWWTPVPLQNKIVTFTVPPRADGVASEAYPSNEGSVRWSHYVYAANMELSLRRWQCSVNPALRGPSDTKAEGTTGLWQGTWGGTLAVEAHGQSLHWRGRDQRGSYDVHSRPQSAEALSWLRQLARQSANDAPSVEASFVARSYAILLQDWADGAELRVLHADGNWETLIQSARFNRLIVEPASDGHVYLAMARGDRWDLVHLGSDASVVATRWIVVGAHDALRLTDRESGPGFVLVHAGQFREYSLMPGSVATVLPNPPARVTLCGGRGDRGGVRLFEPTLAQLGFDRGSNWAFYGDLQSAPSDTVAIVQIDQSGACLRGIRTHSGVATHLESDSRSLRGIAYDSLGEHTVRCQPNGTAPR